MESYTIIGLISVIFIFFRLIKKIGIDLPILDLIFLIAGLQWIVGPYLDYQTVSTHNKYYMYVSEKEYMSIVVPMFIAMIIPHYLFLNKSLNLRINFNGLNLNKIAIFLIVIGLSANIIGKFVPSSLFFVFYLLKNLLFVGSAVIMFQKNKKLKIIAYITFLWLFYSSIVNGLFHDLILWGMLLFFIWALGKPIKWYFTLILFGISFFSISLVQSIKDDFRKNLTLTSNPVELFSNMIKNSFNQGIANTNDDLNDLNVRLNQGWIISAIIKNVPKKEPYAEGETITAAVSASILPRFLNPNKASAGGRDNFIRFTGLPLRKGTSMGTSIVGEAYANYGLREGVLFMFIWGIFLVLFWRFLIKTQQYRSLLLFFIPLIFFQAIKAETELVVVLNHITKASIISFFILWIINNFIVENVTKKDEEF